MGNRDRVSPAVDSGPYNNFVKIPRGMIAILIPTVVEEGSYGKRPYYGVTGPVPLPESGEDVEGRYGGGERGKEGVNHLVHFKSNSTFLNPKGYPDVADSPYPRPKRQPVSDIAPEAKRLDPPPLLGEPKLNEDESLAELDEDVNNRYSVRWNKRKRRPSKEGKLRNTNKMGKSDNDGGAEKNNIEKAASEDT